MLFPLPPRTAEDIRAFCRRFTEGIRVEYKRNFDENVRRNLAKIVSSFANSLGGVLILGVNAVNGVPQEPIDGFEPEPREEVPLTVENLCIQNTYPAIFPKITEVPSDVEGKRFVTIEVDESPDAPHAIENSTKVYVRTGNAANPYELAHVDSVIELLRRRENPLGQRQLLFERAHVLGLHNDGAQAQVAICPVMPKRPLCSAADCWNFLRNTPYRGGHFFPIARMRRVEGGAAAFPDHECADVNRYGFVFGRKNISTHRREGDVEQYLDFSELFDLYVRIYWCAASFLERIHFRGDVLIELKLMKVLGQSLPFIPWEHNEIRDFASNDREVSASQITPSEDLRTRLLSTTQEIFAELCWPFWQSHDEFPREFLNRYIAVSLAGRGFQV